MCRSEVNKVCLSWTALHFHFLRHSFLNLKLRHLARWSGQWAPFSIALPILAHSSSSTGIFLWLAETYKKFNNSVWVSVQWHFSSYSIKTHCDLFPAITSLHEIHTYKTFFYSVQLKHAQGLGKCLSGQTCFLSMRASVQIPRAHSELASVNKVEWSQETPSINLRLPHDPHINLHTYVPTQMNSYIHYKHMHPTKLFCQQKRTLIIFFKESVLEKFITKSTAMTISSPPVPPLWYQAWVLSYRTSLKSN